MEEKILYPDHNDVGVLQFHQVITAILRLERPFAKLYLDFILLLLLKRISYIVEGTLVETLGVNIYSQEYMIKYYYY